MISFLFGFAVGVIAGPVFLAKVWPKVRAWWDDATGLDDD